MRGPTESATVTAGLPRQQAQRRGRDRELLEDAVGLAALEAQDLGVLVDAQVTWISSR